MGSWTLSKSEIWQDKLHQILSLENNVLNGCFVLWVHWGGRPTSLVAGPPSETTGISALQNPENGPTPLAYAVWVHAGRENLASLCTVALPSKSFFLHYIPYLSL